MMRIDAQEEKKKKKKVEELVRTQSTTPVALESISGGVTEKIKNPSVDEDGIKTIGLFWRLTREQKTKKIIFMNCSCNVL